MILQVLAIIAEYNPFHNGHFYQLQESLRKIKADYTIAIMSGNFLQRGEPALVDKWIRTKMALAAGIDLVLELPFVYAVRSAQDFAYGAVNILEATGVVNYLSFGSEIGDLSLLQKVSSLIQEENEQLNKQIKEELSLGLPYPQAQSQALQKIHPHFDPNIWQPNNILALEYLKSLKKLNSSIQPLTINRKSANYHDLEIMGNFASASGIREIIKAQQNTSPDKILSTLEKVIPPTSRQILGEEFKLGNGPIFAEHFSQVLLSTLRKIPTEILQKQPDVIEGLEKRIKAKAQTAVDWSDLVEQIKTKRYTRTRIQRILIHHLLNFTKEDVALFKSQAEYIRILGFSAKAHPLLKELRKKATLPILQKIKKNHNYPYHLNKMLSFDLLATDLYCLAYQNNEKRKAGQDFSYTCFPSKS